MPLGRDEASPYPRSSPDNGVGRQHRRSWTSGNIRNGLRAALAEAGIDPLPDDIVLERPANDHGDWSSNMPLTAKKAGKNPRTRSGAGRLPHRAPTGPCHRCRDRRPGFVNFRLAEPGS